MSCRKPVSLLFEKKNQNGWLKKTEIFKIANSQKILRKFHRLVLDWFELFGCFWAYVGQPHGHIGWATSMPFTSINSTNPRTNPWNYREIFWELAILKISVFLSRPFWFFFSKNYFLFASFLWKSAQIYMVEWMGRNFDVFPGFQKIPCYA